MSEEHVDLIYSLEVGHVLLRQYEFMRRANHYLQCSSQGTQTDDLAHSSFPRHDGTTVLPNGDRASFTREDLSQAHGHKTKQARKGIRLKSGIAKLIVGEDIAISKVLDYLENVLMGHFCGQIASSEAIYTWIDEQWRPLLGYSPSFNHLSRGWLLFKLI